MLAIRYLLEIFISGILLSLFHDCFDIQQVANSVLLAGLFYSQIHTSLSVAQGV